MKKVPHECLSSAHRVASVLRYMDCSSNSPLTERPAVPLNTCDPKEVTMVWVLLLSMAMPQGGGVAIEKFAYYSTEGECIKARTIFGKDGKSQTPRIPLALC